MCLSYISQRTDDGIQYTPNNGGNTYLSIYAHRGQIPNKNQWDKTIAPQTEYEIFLVADCLSWKCNKGVLWGFHNECSSVLGTRGEYLCQFPSPTNVTDPWHGYPVSPKKDGDTHAPPDDLVEKWKTQKFISTTTARKIQRRKI